MQIFARGGYKVTLFDTVAKQLEGVLPALAADLEKLKAAGLLGDKNVDVSEMQFLHSQLVGQAIVQLVSTTTELEDALKDAVSAQVRLQRCTR